MIRDVKVQMQAAKLGNVAVEQGGPVWEAHEVKSLVIAAYLAGYQTCQHDQREKAA